MLTEQVAVLEDECTGLKSENAHLKEQLKHFPQEGDALSQDTIKILKLLFDRANDVSMEEIIKLFHLKPSVADYHIDVLLKRKFIREASIGMRSVFGNSGVKFGLTLLGRRFVLEHTVH